MTLILAVATPRFVALLSDQRISWPLVDAEGKRTGEFDYRDGDMKTIVVDERYVMGFTGLGTMGKSHQRMEYWLADAIGTKGPGERFKNLGEVFGEALEEQKVCRSHTFVAAGYYLDEEGVDRPEIVVVSNSLSHDAQVVQRTYNFAHTLDAERLRLKPGQGYRCLSVGAPVEPTVERNFKNVLNRLSGHHDIEPAVLLPEMIKVLRDTAQRQLTVSKSCVITSFPVEAVPLNPGAEAWMGSPPDSAYRTGEVSVTVPAADRPDDRRRFYPARIGQVVIRGDLVEFGRQGFIPQLDRTMNDAEALFRREVGEPF